MFDLQSASNIKGIFYKGDWWKWEKMSENQTAQEFLW